MSENWFLFIGSADTFKIAEIFRQLALEIIQFFCSFPILSFVNAGNMIKVSNNDFFEDDLTFACDKNKFLKCLIHIHADDWLWSVCKTS